MAVSAAMDDIDDAIDEALDVAGRKDEADTARSRRETYEKSLHGVRDVAGTDAMEELRDWIVAEIQQEKSPPGSRQVRKAGARIAREHGAEVSTNDWLGA